MHCPQGSYDVNIEPAKDDLLFGDKEKVLSLVEDLFKDAYGELTDTTMRRATSTKRDETANDNSFGLLLARKDATHTGSQPSDADRISQETPTFEPYTPFKSPFPSNRHNLLRRDRRDPSQLSHSAVEQGPQESEFVNPWSLTKLNTLYRTPDKSKQNSDSIHLKNRSSMSRAMSNNRVAEKHQQASSTTVLPSPSTSNSVPASPTNSNTSPSLFRFSQASQIAPTHLDSRQSTREHDRERYGNGALDTWFQKTTQAGLLKKPSEDQSIQHEDEPSLTQLAEGRFGSEERRSTSSSTAVQELPQHVPIATPSQTLEVPERQKELPVLVTPSSNLHWLSAPIASTEVEVALDFERRKKEAIRKRREQMKHRSEMASSTNPHQNRYQAARAVLNSEINPTQAGEYHSQSEQNTSQPKLSLYDPRAYLIRQQRAPSRDGNKARRITTNKLPLEKVPDGCDLHDVCLSLSADESVLVNSTKYTLTEDLYAQRGADIEAFSTTTAEDTLSFWTQRLSTLIRGNYTNAEGHTEPEFQFDYSSISQM